MPVSDEIEAASRHSPLAPATAVRLPEPASVAVAGLDEAIRAARAVLLAEQRCPAGYWVGELSSSPLATAMAALALHLRDRHANDERVRRAVAWLLLRQHADGGWGDALDDPSNINTTSLAVAVLTMVAPGEPGVAEALRHARRLLDTFGGYAAVGDPQRCTLSGPCRTVSAVAGLMDASRMKILRPDVILLPRGVRRTISTTFPAYLSLSTLHDRLSPAPAWLRPVRPRSLRLAREWLARAQGPNGSFEESAFLTGLIVMALQAAGLGALPWLQYAVEFLLVSQRDDGSWPIDRDLETFDTDMAIFALHESGADLATERFVATRDWLLARQFDVPCFPTGAAPGGWAWAMPAGWPDADDTSYTIRALRLLGAPHDAPALRRGCRWLLRMQNRDGAWPTFVRNSRMPFDHACPYITGHVLSALHSANAFLVDRRPLERALAYLQRVQRPDGSFAAVWFRDYVSGTAAVLEALVDLELAATPMARRCARWLLANQNDDGSWGPWRGFAGSATGTAEETGWALATLSRTAEGRAARPALARAAAWLVGAQQPGGAWAPTALGLYYSALCYADSYYALTLPLIALSRFQRMWSG
jgi:squalene-hopene/tetraprenyl-beta-curcumene cyclase